MEMVKAMNIESLRNDWLGQVVDQRFPLLEWLGTSGESAVFLTEVAGERTDRPQKAAIKLLPADVEDAESRIAGWEAAQELSHPNLARVFHAGRCRLDTQNAIYVVTEFSDEILGEIVAIRPLSPHEAREMLAPVIEALDYLHGKGFVHGRIKPSNIMVVNDQLKISGDSLHGSALPVEVFPASGIHDAPERADGLISPASDIWSLGVTMVEALTQHPPVWNRASGKEPVPPMPLLPPFAEIAQETLHVDPDRRCTLIEIRSCLKMGAHIPTRAADDDDDDEDEEEESSRPRIIAIVAVVLVVVAAIAVFALRSQRPKPAPPSTAPDTSSATASAPATDATPTPAPSAPPQPQAPASPAPATAPAPQPPGSAGPSTKGEVAQRVLPDVPAKASRTIQGKVDVSVRVTVDASGAVTNAAFQSAGPSRYFSNLALEASRSWKFKPAQTGGQPTTSKWLLKFQFRQSGVEVAPVEETP
jgi:TonB family protein